MKEPSQPFIYKHFLLWKMQEKDLAHRGSPTWRVSHTKHFLCSLLCSSFTTRIFYTVYMKRY